MAGNRGSAEVDVIYTDCLKIEPRIIGRAQIIHDEPTPFDRLRGALHGQPLNRSKYCRLMVGDDVVMTDAEFERRTNSAFIRDAHGDVLVAGLGIGLILDPLLKRCDSVTVIEKEIDVITLVGPHFPGCRILHADIFKWKPREDEMFDTIYFDIWAHFNEDMAQEGRTLTRRFRKYLRPGGYIDNWARHACRAGRRS